MKNLTKPQIKFILNYSDTKDREYFIDLFTKFPNLDLSKLKQL